MAAGVLIDTSFFITLADSNRKHNEAARRYWRHFLESQIPIYLSTIVASEFCVKQEIPADILRCCVVFHSTGKMLRRPQSLIGNACVQKVWSAMR